MPTPVPQLSDGDFFTLTETEGRIKSYPFLNAQAKDTTTTRTRRPYIVHRDAYTPAAALSADPDDAAAYLIDESEPEYLEGEMLRVWRTYAKIPTDQISYEMRPFARPSMHGVKAGSYWGVSWDDDASTWLFGVRKTINTIAPLAASTKAVTGTVAGTGSIAGTGTIAGSGTVAGTGTLAGSGTVGAVDSTQPSAMGHVLITVEGNNSPRTFYTDDSDATIRNAMSLSFSGTTTYATAASFPIVRNSSSLIIGCQGLSYTLKTLTSASSVLTADVGSGRALGVAGEGNVIEITADKADGTGTDTRATLDTRSTTDTRSITDTRNTTDTRNLTDTSNLLETYYPDASVRLFTVSAGHSASAGDLVVFWQGDRIVALSIVISVPTSTTFTALMADVGGADFAAATCGFSSGAAYRYVNGPKDCTVKVTEKYYLPGVSVGITTGADIPQTTLYADPVGWLTAISAGSAFAAIETRTSAWQGAFLVKRIEEVQLADALESRGVNA